MRQEMLLRENESLDYVIVLPSGRHDIGVSFGDPECKVMFRVARAKAPNEPVFVNRMYEWLSISHPNEREIIRKQLLAEYGVDPESDEVGGVFKPLTEDDLARATSCH